MGIASIKIIQICDCDCSIHKLRRAVNFTITMTRQKFTPINSLSVVNLSDGLFYYRPASLYYAQQSVSNVMSFTVSHKMHIKNAQAFAWPIVDDRHIRLWDQGRMGPERTHCSSKCVNHDCNSSKQKHCSLEVHNCRA